MTNLEKIRWRLGISALALVFIAGCAEQGPILLDIGYPAHEERPAATSKVVAGVSPFRDDRGKPESTLGRRTIPSGLQNDLVVQGTVSGLVAASLKDALKARGITVKDVPGWDRTAEGMKSEGIGLLFGGVIKTLWLESTATTLKTHLIASVQLKIVAGDPADRKIIKTINVDSTVEQDVLYSTSKLEEALSEALAGAIDQIFNDEDLNKELR
jgi:uncharacterized lipoprotein YajG